MNGVSDIFKYHPEYFVAIFQLKFIRGHEVKAINFDILVVQYLFLGQIFVKIREKLP